MSEEEDWPYEKIEVVTPLEAPSWLCPDDKCTCSEKEHDHEPFTCSVMLTDPSGARMPGARVRVVVNGILVNEDEPNADGSGWISVELRRKPDTMQIEWAPADTPDRPELPYRKLYYVDLHEHQPEEAARRRLHNLGFTWLDSLRKNIEDFQCEFHAPKITGEVEDVEEQLKKFHDDGKIPIVERPDKSKELDPLPPRRADGRPKRGWDTSVDEPSQPVQLAGWPEINTTDWWSKPKDQADPGPPAKDGPTGTAKPALDTPTKLASILDVIDQGFAAFEWEPVAVTAGGFDAIFWVFKDALKHKDTGRRWPCTPNEAQTACGKPGLRTTSANLPGWPAAATGATTAEDSLFMTPKLYDLRWAKAEKLGQAIAPMTQDESRNMAGENAKMNTRIDAVLGAGWIAADPGKIWALDNTMLDAAGDPLDRDSLPAAVNYGWHVQASGVTPSKTEPGKFRYGGGPISKAATPGQWCIQGVGLRHNNAWIDYSQLLLLTAGWCVVCPTGGTFAAARTEDIYKDAAKAVLVTADGAPLRVTKQPVRLTTAAEKKARKETAEAVQESIEWLLREARILERKDGGWF